MPFIKIPFLLLMFFVLMSGGRIIPFLLVAVGLWFALGVVRQGYRFEQYPTVTPDELNTLRTDVAASLLEVDDDLRLKTNRDARSRFEAAGAHYTKASKAMDRGVRRRDREAVAKTLYRARYELEATAASLDGRTIPEEPATRHTNRQPVMVAPRPSRQRRHSYCGW